MSVTTIPTAGIADTAVSTAKIADNAVTVSKADFNNVNFKNLIINGDMSVAQRGTSSTGITSSGYRTCDRFLIAMENLGTWTITQDTNTPSNQGFANSLKLQCTTADASPASTDELYIYSKIEGQNLQQLNYGESGAKSLTLSFWVKSNKTGTASLNFMQRDNSKKLYTTNYSISSADTWEKKTITISGDTSGLINNDNGSGFEVFWWFNSGSSYQTGTTRNAWSSYTDADVNVSNLGLGGSTSDNISITGVQLEVGTSASDFEFLPHDINKNRCDRYYKDISSNDFRLYTTALDGNTSDRLGGTLGFTTEMRTSPSVTKTVANSQSVESQQLSPSGYSIFTSVSNRGGTTHIDEMKFDAEL